MNGFLKEKKAKAKKKRPAGRVQVSDSLLFGLRCNPAHRESLQVRQALEQILPAGREAVAIGAVGDEARHAQIPETGVERVGGDAADAVLQQAEGLGVSVAQRPYHADGVARLQQGQQLISGGGFLGLMTGFS